MKRFFSLLTIFLILNFSAFAAKKADKYLSIKATSEGLEITKKHPAMFKYVTIHVQGEDSENISINATDKENKFLYPFVENGKFLQLIKAVFLRKVIREIFITVLRVIR